MYQKIIQSGLYVEVFTYEKEPAPRRLNVKKCAYKNPFRYHRNISRARSAFFRLVQANLGPDSRPAFVTLTMREITTIREGWRAYTRFADKWRRSTKARISIIAVPEFQERGAVHFHLLVWGLYDAEIDTERSTRSIAKLWGHGFVDVRRSDGSPKIAAYLAKYMFKAMYDQRLAGSKSYSASRFLLRPVHLRSRTAVALVEAEINGDRIESDGTILKGVDKPLAPQKHTEYPTQWLGKCDYKLYDFRDYGNQS